MRGRHLLPAGLVAAMLALAACGAAVIPSANTDKSYGSSGVAAPRATMAPAFAPAPSLTGSRAAESSAQATSDDARMIIRNANLAIVVKDTLASLDEIQKLVDEMKGFITNSRTWEESDQIRGSVTLRVPAGSMDAALDRIKKLAVKPATGSTSGNDVTEEYADLGAQLKNLQATETELQALLTTVRERTGKAEDILAVFNQLTAIRGQIEQLQGRMQYLSRLTDLATITVDITPEPLEKPVVQPGFNPGAVLRSAARALVQTLKGLGTVLIWLIGFVLPILLIVAIPVVVILLIVRRSRRSARRNQA